MRRHITIGADTLASDAHHAPQFSCFTPIRRHI
jgi:hypothetical protein